MHFYINTNHKKMVFGMNVTTKGNKIVILGHDKDSMETEYFNRQVLVDGAYEFNLPQSPRVLKVVIAEENEGNIENSEKYSISDFYIKELELKPLLLDSDASEFVRFAQWFSVNLAKLCSGDYCSDNSRFNIRLYDEIAEDKGTPSRIHKYSGLIEVSKKWFVGMTVAGRMATLLHEYSHNHLESGDARYNSSNKTEIEADDNAIKIYLGLGYPRVEWIYTWTHMFHDNDMHVERLDNANFQLQQNR